ncbi:DUF4908 domain-containing protein [uncultured Brevundimonas sp.]|uniref:DUF4908 domain-containing protein n=1 Tax=uncultured Brevundimonas sp. TaxID=213418 RepID=UPI0025D720E1|nr:DUF4908 domain-containing protein [uncultured Brevundimonas sp.]
MAAAIVAGVLSLLASAQPVDAQSRSNAQAEQSSQLRSRGGAPAPTPAPALPASGRYVAESGEGFMIDRSGPRPLLRFDRREETWVLRPSAAPRGDVIYRNDAGEQVLRVTQGGAITVYTPRTPGGSPAAYSGAGQSLAPPSLGPVRLFDLMARRSVMLSQALGRLVEINLDGDESEALCVEALIVTTDAVARIARSPSARSRLNGLRSITIIEGARAGVTYRGGRLVVTVDPSQGQAGRPSSTRVIRALLPEPRVVSR